MNHRVESESGHVAEFVISEDGRILDMLIDWPEGQDELVFSTGVPAHASVQGVPEHIRERAGVLGWEVCYYDPDRCRTCFCDDAGHMRCSGMC